MWIGYNLSFVYIFRMHFCDNDEDWQKWNLWRPWLAPFYKLQKRVRVQRGVDIMILILLGLITLEGRLFLSRKAFDMGYNFFFLTFLKNKIHKFWPKWSPWPPFSQIQYKIQNPWTKLDSVSYEQSMYKFRAKSHQ